ncbi:MAG: hypothetical protein K5894_12315 [Lachnospiraceae bacterium]|nr:hypothetical protein [Lachnospiraceae bacterium]
MGKVKCILKSIAALSLSAMLTVNSVPTMTIAAVNDNEAIIIENESSEITTGNESTEEASDNKDTGKKTEEKAEIWERAQSVNEMTVTVTADAGIFPDDAELSVKKVSRTQEKEAEKAVESERDEEENVAKFYTYDIKVLDKDGKEIEPKDDENVKVSFRLDEVADENLTTNIYHIIEKDTSSVGSADSFPSRGSHETGREF